MHRLVPIVLCAGFGTRLRPLSYAVPKVAAPMGAAGPIAWDAIRQLFEAGAPVVHVNTHYRAAFVRAELGAACLAAGYDLNRIRFWHEQEILETGGGIARILRDLQLEDAVYATADALVLSGDIFGDIPLASMIGAWSAYADDEAVGGLMMSLPLLEERKDKTWISEDGNWVIGFGPAAPADHPRAGPRLFSNHQLISRRLLKCGRVEKESSVTMYYRHAHKMGLKLVHAPLASNLRWFNVGTYPEYSECLSTLSLAAEEAASAELPAQAWSLGLAGDGAQLAPLSSALQCAGRFRTWCLPEEALAASLSQWLRSATAAASSVASSAASASASLPTHAAQSPHPDTGLPVPVAERILAFLTPSLELDLPASALRSPGIPASAVIPVSGEDPLLVPLELLLKLAPSGLVPADLFGSLPADFCYGTSKTYFVIPWSRRLRS